MDDRVGRLIHDFPGCLDSFETARLFTGPSLYFHNRALECRRRNTSVSQLLDDDSFFDYLYATLTAWGMHRMGPGNTKLRDLDDIRDSFRQQAGPIADLSFLQLTQLDHATTARVASDLWAIMDKLRVGIGETKIVANSKALHHVLPDLIPPMDREYTLAFFYHHKTLNQGDEVAFKEMYPRFHRMATARADEIVRRLGTSMHTSETKVLDNAIVGYVRKFLPKPKKGTGSVP